MNLYTILRYFIARMASDSVSKYCVTYLGLENPFENSDVKSRT